MRKLIWLQVFLIVVLPAFSQSKYGLKVTTLSGYQANLKDNADKELINLEKFVPGLVLDIRYATTNNFVGRALYTTRDESHTHCLRNLERRTIYELRRAGG